MCGVVGVYAYSGRAAALDRDEVRAIRDHMAIRGPDGSGEWFSRDGRIALAHRRLSIIDLSERGAQPMASADGQVVISFNGEIYNYRELKRELQARGRHFVSDSDTEVLLQLYQEHGTQMLGMLRGMFAFALWDSVRKEMLLARDPFGIKPLYYSDDGNTLRMASQVKALLRAGVDTSPEPAGHAGFFLWGSVPAPWTLYRGIRSLLPGHFMWIGPGGARAAQPFCIVRDILAQAARNPARGNAAQALEAVTEAIRDSLKAHLVSDVPVGIFLSSGLDSAIIASLAAEGGASTRALTLGFLEYAGTAADEHPLAHSLAQQLHMPHSAVTVRRADFEGEHEKILAAMDQPSIDGVNTWFVAAAAASQGIKVALSGLGGDELFGSYPSFREVPRLAKLASPFRLVPRLGRCIRTIAEPWLRRLTSPKYAGLLEYGGSMAGAYLLRRGLYMPWELPRVMDPDMARAGWRDLQTMAQLEQSKAGIASMAADRFSVSALEMSWYMRHQLLPDADWAGMGHSLEIRLPFVDVPLLRATAPWFAAHPGITKRDIARAASPQLPEAFLNKPKTGFTVPVREWLGVPSESARGLRGWARHVHEQHRVAPRQTRCGRNDRNAPRVLVSTIAPGPGGVNAMTKFVVSQLARRGLEPVIAHYVPYSVVPSLSVPFYRLLQRRAGWQQGVDSDNHETHAIGAWLPELEFTHYAATSHWRELMDTCEAFVAVSGNVLAATPFQQTGRPYLAWIATDWQGDREARVKSFPLARRWLDTCINAPIIRRVERKLLRSGNILSISRYTANTLSQITGAALRRGVLPMPVDSAFFVPKPEAVVRGRLGFAGRYSDPRKNIGLFLETVALLRAEGHDVTAMLMGDTPLPTVTRLADRLGLRAHVTFLSHLTLTELRDCMQTLDVFVLPSHQEGLCIAALEALACGTPVVSTRCGGPEEFVISGRTGILVDSAAHAMATAIRSLIVDPAVRERMGDSARRLVEDRYSRSHAESTFEAAFASTFPTIPRHP